MKTAQSIEEQEERKAARGDGKRANSMLASKQPSKRKGPHGDFSRIAQWAWKPGQSGNPKGNNGRHDIAKEIAVAVFERNAEALYKAYTKAALKGNAYCFKELADRAFGKLKEKHELEVHPYHDQSEEQLQARIQELEKALGYSREEPEPLLPAGDDPKPN